MHVTYVFLSLTQLIEILHVVYVEIGGEYLATMLLDQKMNNYFII